MYDYKSPEGEVRSGVMGFVMDAADSDGVHEMTCRKREYRKEMDV